MAEKKITDLTALTTLVTGDLLLVVDSPGVTPTTKKITYDNLFALISVPITFANAAGPTLVNEAATATNPTLIPNKAEDDTGVGWAAADSLAFILGGVEYGRFTTSNLRLKRSASEQSGGLEMVNYNPGGWGSQITFYSNQDFGSDLEKAAASIAVTGSSAWTSDATTDSDMTFYVVQNATNTAMMSITGDSGLVDVVNQFTAGTKTFKIDHPLDPDNKNLYHMSIEGPRVDLIYRGVAQLVNGIATVDLNADSTSHPMMDGTFEALTQNAVVTSLQNQDGFDRVRPGEIDEALFDIICENSSCNDKVAWVVMAERADPFIKSIERTDEEGRMIPEADKEAPDLTPLEDKIVGTDIEKDVGESFESVKIIGKGYKIHHKAYGEELLQRKVIKIYVPEEDKKEL